MPNLSLALAALLAVALPAAALEEKPQTSAKKRFHCPDCGQPCDQRVFDAPGSCPDCGMALVEEGGHKSSAAARQKAAILVFNGVEIIDFAGPYEVFGAAGFDVYTVGETKEPVTTAMGLKIVPRYAFADAPAADVLVVPGGGVDAAQKNEALLTWVTQTAGRAQKAMSVCNGAFILASAGLLDGLSATTTAHHLDRLKSQFPRIAAVVSDQRFVDNGKIVTTGGLSAGIDGALHLVARLRGQGFAQAVALAIEYDWRPGAGFARAALADRQLPQIEMLDSDRWEILKYEGNRDRWTLAFRPRSSEPPRDVLDRIATVLARSHWTKVNDSPALSEWKFTGKDGKPWKGILSATGGSPQSFQVVIARAAEQAQR